MVKLILLASLTLLSLRTFSCTCNPDLKDKDLVRRSEYAFIGEIISNIYKDDWTKEFGGGTGMDAKVRVVKILKGKIVNEAVVVISSQSSSCQTTLIPGKRYLITGSGELNRLPPLEQPPPPVEFDSIYTQDTVKLDQPYIKNVDEWIKELQQATLVIFTSVCQTRSKG